MSVTPTTVKLFVFSIRDVKTNTFSNPYFSSHKAGAMRNFQDLCTDPQSIIKKHPEDFQLYLLGSFDPETGHMDSLPQPEYMSSPSDFNV